MLHLIRKDIFLQKNILIVLIPLLIVYLIMEISNIWLGIIFCIAVIMQSFSTDEKTSAQTLLNSLPYTRKEIVSAKYLGALVFIFLTLLILFLGNLLIHKEIIPLKELLFVASFVLLFISFVFPISYMFKSQYMFIVVAVLFVVYLVIVNTFIPNFNDIVREMTNKILSLDNLKLYVVVGVFLGFLYLTSWIISIFIYKRKEF